jgi:hypothetical protein
MTYSISRDLLMRTFKVFRDCGYGARECQVLWTSSWLEPYRISRLIHPHHQAHAGGFSVESQWLTALWNDLAQAAEGIRIQVHTHPYEAFHSAVDDLYPVVHSSGFLSLVIPNYGIGPIDLNRAYLTQIQNDGSWKRVAIPKHIRISQ